jgi:HPt (histidine-containing phosphotransfer) domain-containing protein
MGTNPDEVTFDLELTRRNFDHDEGLVREIGGIFIEDVPQLVEQLSRLRDQLLSANTDEQGVAQGAIALREAKRLAHSIKGLAATFGAEPLVSLAQEIEEELACIPLEHSAAKIQRLAEIAVVTVGHLAVQLQLVKQDDKAASDPRRR